MSKTARGCAARGCGRQQRLAILLIDVSSLALILQEPILIGACRPRRHRLGPISDCVTQSLAIHADILRSARK
jgi:hypothetical protein